MRGAEQGDPPDPELLRIASEYAARIPFAADMVAVLTSGRLLTDKQAGALRRIAAKEPAAPVDDAAARRVWHEYRAAAQLYAHHALDDRPSPAELQACSYIAREASAAAAEENSRPDREGAAWSGEAVEIDWLARYCDSSDEYVIKALWPIALLKARLAALPLRDSQPRSSAATLLAKRRAPRKAKPDETGPALDLAAVAAAAAALSGPKKPAAVRTLGMFDDVPPPPSPVAPRRPRHEPPTAAPAVDTETLLLPMMREA